MTKQVNRLALKKVGFFLDKSQINIYKNKQKSRSRGTLVKNTSHHGITSTAVQILHGMNLHPAFLWSCDRPSELLPLAEKEWKKRREAEGCEQ